MLAQTKAVRKRTLWSVDRLLESDWKIVIQVCHLWSLPAYDVGSDIVGVLVREYGASKVVPMGMLCMAQAAAVNRRLIPAPLL
jgi:hypothetical protein